MNKLYFFFTYIDYYPMFNNLEEFILCRQHMFNYSNIFYMGKKIVKEDLNLKNKLFYNIDPIFHLHKEILK